LAADRQVSRLAVGWTARVLNAFVTLMTKCEI